MAADSTPEEEVRRLERHYSVNPEGLVFARLADAYRRCGRLERSLELLREGLERHPDYTTGHLIEGRTLREADRPDEAAESFRRVLGLDAGNLVALRSLAELAAERGDMAEADRWADRLEQADPFTSFDPAEVAARARASEDEESVQSAGEAESPGPGAAEGEREDVGADGPTDLPGEEGLASEIAAMADDQWWSSSEEDRAATGDAADGSDVATETMAHLYAQQGLYEEAADVYRRLVERRPDDEKLRDRLEEMARRAGGQGQDAAGQGRGAPPADEAPPADARDPSRGESAASGEEAAGSGPAVSAREHFRALLRGGARPAGEGAGEGDEAVPGAADHVAAGDRREAAGGAAG